MPKLTPCLWFDTQGEDAANFYVAIFPNSRITEIARYGEAGPRPAGMVMTVAFELDGQPFSILNGGPEFTFSAGAISFQIPCQDQAEVDHYWTKLQEGGGREVECGWLIDKFGVPWQVFPEELSTLLSDPDPARADRAMKAMMTMTKIDLDALRRAADAA